MGCDASVVWNEAVLDVEVNEVSTSVENWTSGSLVPNVLPWFVSTMLLRGVLFGVQTASGGLSSPTPRSTSLEAGTLPFAIAPVSRLSSLDPFRCLPVIGVHAGLVFGTNDEAVNRHQYWTLHARVNLKISPWRVLFWSSVRSTTPSGNGSPSPCSCGTPSLRRSMSWLSSEPC